MKKYTDLEVIGEKPLDSGMAIAFDKGKHTELIQKINEELKTLKSNGKYDELINKYGLKVTKQFLIYKKLILEINGNFEK